jgi:hypothetical protein
MSNPEENMLSREMATIIENAAADGTLHYNATDVMERVANEAMAASDVGRRLLPHGIQANLTEIICGTRFYVGQKIRINPIGRIERGSSSLIPDREVGTITTIRWPNSENRSQLVIQADFHERNFHFLPTEIEAISGKSTLAMHLALA